MFNRLANPPKSRSFFLFGARGTGKSTLLETVFSGVPSIWIDLLNQDEEARYAARPQLLAGTLDEMDKKIEWVIIDEIQKIPELLDVVQGLMKKKKYKFALTGSSARKLKRGAANLLAGRASTLNLFPLTFRELKESFTLDSMLQWGSLPEIFSINDSDRAAYLRSYCQTYLKEEVIAEQLIRKLSPFRAFLEVAAQMSGKILNHSKIARDIDSDPVSVQSYFSILEDTLLGFSLPPYHRSVRKRQRKAVKFLFFDLGVERALTRTLEVPLTPQTYAFGEAFERLVINEIYRLKTYLKPDWELSYFSTKDDAEIDLIVDRPGMPTALVEIKSTTRILEDHIRTLAKTRKDFGKHEAFCLSLDPKPQKVQGISCLPWQQGIAELGL